MTLRFALTSPLAMKKYSGDFLSDNNTVMTRLRRCAQPLSSSPAPVLERLHGDRLMSSRIETGASKQSQTSIAAQIRAAYTRLPSHSKYSITSYRVDIYSALVTCRSLPLPCSSLTLITGFQSPHLSSTCSSSSPENADYINCGEFHTTSGAEVLDSPRTKEHPLEPE